MHIVSSREHNLNNLNFNLNVNLNHQVQMSMLLDDQEEVANNNSLTTDLKVVGVMQRVLGTMV